MTTFNYDLPYPSQRQPLFARNMVTTSQPLAAQAGLQMLRQGGNAMDAALAAGIALAVVEPSSNGIGGDAFALVWDGKALHGLNGSGRSGAGMTPEQFKGMTSIPDSGAACVTVPGQVAAWLDLSKRFGKLDFGELFLPAIRYARDGFHVSPVTAGRWAVGAKKFKDRPDFMAAFVPGGRAPKTGDVWRFPEQAATLESIAETKGESFYRGPLANRILDHLRAQGGWITADDLAGHDSEWVRPISHRFAGCDIHEIPPNGQGLAALLMLGIAEFAGVRDHAVDSADSAHIQIEAMKLAFADAHRYIADPEFMTCTVEELLRPEYLQSRAKLIHMKQAGDFAHGSPKEGGTIYLAAADEHGMMVSYIQSNYTGFGSGVVVPGTGISLQNRGIGFSLEAGHPNQVGPRKRPYHTIIPGFATRDGKPELAFGVMGGPMQPQGHAQMMIRILAHNQNPQAACDAPRWLVGPGREVGLEPWAAPGLAEDLAARGHDVKTMDPLKFGGAQIIARLDDGYCGASDPRKDGYAVGF